MKLTHLILSIRNGAERSVVCGSVCEGERWKSEKREEKGKRKCKRELWARLV